MRPPLLVLAAATLVACQTPPTVETRKGLDEGIDACVAATTAVLERLNSKHAACAEDADCVPVAQVWLGCTGWHNVHTPLPGDAEASMLSACTGIPTLGLNCDGNVGACVAGRCSGRARAGTSCESATASLTQRALAPTKCQEDADCGEWWIAKTAHPVGSHFAADAAREIHTVADSCDEESRPRPASHDASPNVPRCAGGTCSMAPSTRPPTKYEKPTLLDRKCVVAHLAALGTGLKLAGKATVKFVVGPDGRAGAFQFIGPVPKGLYAPIILGIVECKWNPGRRDGKPTPIWVVQPINFK